MTRPRACLIRQADRIETSLSREYEALVEQGYDVDVVIMRPPGPAYWAELPPGVTVRTVPTRRRRGGIGRYLLDYATFTLLASAVVAYQHLRRRYAVVQVQSMPDGLVIAGLVPQLLGAALTMKVAEPTPQLSETLGQPDLVRRIVARVQRWAARTADSAITVTDELAADLIGRGVDAESVHVVHNVPSDSLGDLATGARPPDDRFTVVCHGTMLERYGQDTILHAVARIRDQIPGIEVLFTGSDDDWPEYKQTVTDLGLGDIVEHHVRLPLPELVRRLERSHVGVVAQKASPYSHLVHTNKMYEYLLFGIPAVVSRLRATEAFLGEGDVRYFTPGDADDLARVLVELHDDPAARTALGVRGRARWDRCSWNASQRAAYLGAVDHARTRRAARRR